VLVVLELLKCFEIALDKANEMAMDKSTDQARFTNPAISLVPLGIALSYLVEQETLRYGNLARVGQRLVDLLEAGSGNIATRQVHHLKAPRALNNDFEQALKGYMALLSPEMPPKLKQVWKTIAPVDKLLCNGTDHAVRGVVFNARNGRHASGRYSPS
jgi:hypothetical protein